jgi:hypothetical protein
MAHISRRAYRTKAMNTSPIGMTDLGDAGRMWIRGSLGDGLALSERCLPLVTDEIVPLAFVVAHEQPIDIHELSIGGLAPPHHDELFDSYVTRDVSGRTLLVCEDDLATPGDLFVSDSSATYFTHEKHVYWFTDDRGAGLTRFLRRSSSGYPLNAFLVRGAAPDFDIGDRRDASDEALDKLTASLEAAIVGASDAEILIWTPM